MKKKIITSIVLISIFLAFTCSSFHQSEIRPKYIYKVPRSTGDGWQTAHFTETNVDEKIIIKLIREILNKPNSVIIFTVL